MLRERRRGHQPAALGASWNPLTARLRRLVDDVHDGNLLEASAHAGLPYAVLRDIHAGRTRRLCQGTVERLSDAYGLPVEWFGGTAAADDGTVPVAGWAGFLPEQCDPAGLSGCRFTIPTSAWSLIRVLVQLEIRLRDLPAEPSRPIIGAATDPRDIRRRLSAFILQPLMAAGSINPSDLRSGRRSERWAGMLTDLGRFWEQALITLLPELPPGTSGEPLGEVA